MKHTQGECLSRRKPHAAHNCYLQTEQEGFISWKRISLRLKASRCKCPKADMQHGGNMDLHCWSPQARQLHHPHSFPWGWRAYRGKYKSRTQVSLKALSTLTPQVLARASFSSSCNRDSISDLIYCLDTAYYHTGQVKKTESSRVWKTDWPNLFLSLKTVQCAAHINTLKKMLDLSCT